MVSAVGVKTLPGVLHWADGGGIDCVTHLVEGVTEATGQFVPGCVCGCPITG
jgi:hypothetical protein